VYPPFLSMRIKAVLALTALALPFATGPVLAQKGVAPTTVIVGGAPMVSDRDIMENLGRSANHEVFVGLLRAAGLADTLQQRNVFTVFAPTDAAFAALPPGQLESLKKPENKAALLKLLQAHVVSGDYSSARLRFMMRSGKGQAELDDIAQGKLMVGTNGPSNIVLRDAKGTMTDIILYDAKQANGVVFVIDRVLQPG
jgi:uncharacterized surface protein with fasciclin (FAS1) repeats